MAGNKMTVGNVEITSLSDGFLEFDLCDFFPSIPEENWDPYESHLTPDHKMRLNIASFLFRSDGRTIIVDTGLGPKPAGAQNYLAGKLLDDVKAKGVRPEDVDMVVMTHPHRDHVGWNLQSQGDKYVPTFPNARYRLSAKDWEACHSPELQPVRFVNSRECVWPLEGLGLVDLMDGETVLTSEVTAIPTPGHTPGHMCILISSQGEQCLILGDLIHSPAQFNEVDWASRADLDAEQARSTRRAVVDRLEREQMRVAAVHMPAPGFGNIVRLDGQRIWQAV